MTDRQPPIARREAAADPYAWLENRDTAEVLDYLKAENAYLEEQLADQDALRETLFQEIKGRIRETDLSLPSPWGPWMYYQRTTAGDEYPRHYRCPRPADGSLTVDESAEQLLLDPNALAGDDFLALGAFSISPDHSRLAYSLDTSGDEIYRLYVKDLASGAVEELPFDDCDGSMTWANDSRTLFFGELDDTHRPHKLYRHTLGEAGAELVFVETDGRFFLHCYRASSERQLVLLLGSKTTSEAWVLDAEQPRGEFRCLAPREEEHEYHVDHGRLDGQWTWFIRSNQSGINFALYSASEAQPTREHWRELIAHREQVMLEDITLNQDALTLSLREGGLPIIEVHANGQAPRRVELPDAAYNLYVHDSLEFDSPSIRLRYEALNRPAQIRQLNLASGAQTVLKETPVEGPFDADAYVSRRLWAPSVDGVQVPISLVARREVLDGIAAGRPAPLYLYGYGAYGMSLDPWFSHARLSLLERGFVFAIAHVRGGGELGEAWYRAGKLAHKQNSFSDFIACAEHICREGYSTPRQTAISGGSAGGLLIGAVLNQRPQQFAAAIAEVPFVDVLNSMLNPDLPLTVTEYDEWGNPQEPEVYQRIKAYAPYENVSAQDYPAMLVVAGYNDSRVQYWEAAKWVAKLRVSKTDERLLLLKTELGAGHGGMSGRYQGLKDVALEYAFLLKVLGLADAGA
ncbi:S9 family peptidase [Pseudomonas panipatensis]|uniref:Oligopeptidase B n=1 Tax=Pseudomonas panipatensis TaxID=428992 RepID=A0A1G8GGB1_9PSED|nr:S9 family peptidase [Pseudomonas panipatensis]SDH93360.1 oligopeptidase B [Pseudomonas panipatensis]SMP43436.1 oligopeptidase B Serine peptidase. MEROPS family S09A [Pseudomonas panipatensis]